MMKTFIGEIGSPSCAAAFEQIKGANNVGLNEIAGAGDGAVDMGFGCQMHHVGDGMLLNDTEDRSLVAKIDFLKCVLRMLRDRFEIGEMAGVGEGIQVHQL